MILINRTGLLFAVAALAWLASCGSSGSSSGTTPSAGGNAYVVVPEANAVASYRVSSGSGDLKAVLGSPFSGGTSAIPISAPPSGKFVFISNQGGGVNLADRGHNEKRERTGVMPRHPARVESPAVEL